MIDCAAGIVVMLLAAPCEEWARIVDIATRLPESEKPARYARWKALTADNKNKYRLVLRAISWVENGGGSASAWRLCY